MNDFETALINYYSADQLQKIQNIRIGLAGAGGLGSNIAVCLALSGFKRFELVDYDAVELKNLNRQYYFLSEVGQAKVEALEKRLRLINPDIQIKKGRARLGPDNILNHFQDSDILFEAFDNVESKKLLLESFGNSSKLIIFGNGMAGVGNHRELKIRGFKPNIYFVGDGETNVGPESPPLAPRVTACAALMASVALESVLKRKK